MEVREMKEKLINDFKSHQAKSLEGYVKKINGMVAVQIKQEYDTVILGKEYKPKKKYGYSKE